MRTVVVIPTYNERENLGQLIAKIHEHAKDLHVLIVDDGSPDGTGQLAEELREKDPERIDVLHREIKEGLGRAYVAGFRRVLQNDYEVIIQMDGDLSHDPCYLPHFLEAIEGSDLVLGSRYLHGISVINWNLRRLIVSKMATFYVRLITRLPFTDTTGGFKCWRRETLVTIGIDTAFSDGYLFQIEMTYKAYQKKLRVKEIPIVFTERSNGSSKFNWPIILEAFLGVLKLRLKTLLDVTFSWSVLRGAFKVRLP